jgi:hypothetical protein
MQQLIEHHHYKKNLITIDDRVSVYERYVIDLLLNTDLPDSQRDSSIAFELKHHHSTSQFARVLARKRGLNEDVCCVGALLHDLYVVVYGSYVDHAHKSAELAEEVLNEIGLFSNDEKKKIIKLIYHHSDKDIWSADPYEEFCKDVDILDSFLYPNAYGYYLKHKKLYVFYNYIKRAKLIWNEMGIPMPIYFAALDNYENNWLSFSLKFSIDIAIVFFAFLQLLCKNDKTNLIVVPTYCITINKSIVVFHFNKASFTSFSECIFSGYGIDLTTLSVDNSEMVSASQKSTISKLLDEAINKVLIIWASLDSYELIDPLIKPERITDLGINVIQ